MKHRIDVSEMELARFCGPWSVSRKTVDVLLCEWEQRNTTAEQSAGSYVRKYLETVKAFVTECEANFPECEDLPFWRKAVAFWERIAALGPPQPAGEPAADPEPSREVFAKFLRRLLDKRAPGSMIPVEAGYLQPGSNPAGA